MLPLLLAAEAEGIYAPVNPGLTSEHATELVRLSGAGVIVASGPELEPRVWAHARAIATKAGARALLEALDASGTKWAIATSGRMETAAVNLQAL